MIWLEILSRHKEVVARRRLDDGASSLTIGRGYGNDVIVDDAYVAAQHLRLSRNAEGTWLAEDLGSQNGLLDAAGRRHTSLPLADDTLLRIGHTWLRVRSDRFPVAPEKPAPVLQRMWPRAAALAVFVAGFSLLEVWLKETDDARLSFYVMAMVSTALALTLWISAWALVSRLFSGAAQFCRHAVIALTGTAAAFVAGPLSKWITFAFSARPFAEYDFLIYWAIFGVTCFYHLRAISARRPRLKMFGVASLCVAAAAVQWLGSGVLDFWHEESRHSGPYLESLWPPATRVIAPQKEDVYFRHVEDLQQHLDALRLKEPKGGSLLDRLYADYGNE